MRRINPKDVLILTLALFIVCIFITAALALTNSVTAPKIAENEAKSQQESMKTVCPQALSFELVKEYENGDFIYKGVDADKNVVGYVVSTVSNGYGGQVKVMTGIKDSKVIGIDVYYNDDETPGLGKNTSNESFTSQFTGLLTNDKIAVSKDGSNNQQVDAVTSSTISSRAVVDAVNKANEIYNNEVGGDK